MRIPTAIHTPTAALPEPYRKTLQLNDTGANNQQLVTKKLEKYNSQTCNIFFLI